MNLEQDHKRLTNIAARLAACLWDFYSTCPECGNDRAKHMPGCAQTYEREFHGPQGTEEVFVKAFGHELYAAPPICPTVPDGWQLVKKSDLQNAYTMASWNAHDQRAAHLLRDMLAAAPEAKP